VWESRPRPSRRARGHRARRGPGSRSRPAGPVAYLRMRALGETRAFGPIALERIVQAVGTRRDVYAVVETDSALVEAKRLRQIIKTARAAAPMGGGHASYAARRHRRARRRAGVAFGEAGSRRLGGACGAGGPRRGGARQRGGRGVTAVLVARRRRRGFPRPLQLSWAGSAPGSRLSTGVSGSRASGSHGPAVSRRGAGSAPARIGVPRCRRPSPRARGAGATTLKRAAGPAIERRVPSLRSAPRSSRCSRAGGGCHGRRRPGERAGRGGGACRRWDAHPG